MKTRIWRVWVVVLTILVPSVVAAPTSGAAEQPNGTIRSVKIAPVQLVGVQGTPKAEVSVTRIPLDPSSGVPIGAPELVARGVVDSTGFHSTISSPIMATSTGVSAASSMQGRAVFRTTYHKYDGCLPLVGCAFGFDMIDDIDASWYAPWGAVTVHAKAKYVPVNADGFYRYDGQSQTYGGDRGYYYNWGGYPVATGRSGYYYRGTAQVAFCPLVGTGTVCAPEQLKIVQRIHSDGTWNSSTASQ